MRMVSSSDPAELARWQAGYLLDQRVVLAGAVVRELQKSGGQDIWGRANAALDLLRGWVVEHYESDVEPHVSDGLTTMAVPEGHESAMAELEAATAVCEAMAKAWTADSQRQLEDDQAEIARLLVSYAY